MEKIKGIIEALADNGGRAEQVYMDTYGMDEKELADYIAKHDAELRELLGIKYLAEKDASPEISNEYFSLLKRGKAMRDPDPYTRKDVNNEDIKGIDYYLEKLGVPKAGGEYNDDIRSKYTNPENPEYVGNWNGVELNNYALEDKQDPEMWRADMLRAATEYQRGNQARGYDADNDITYRWFTDLAEELAFPRIREAKLMGRDWDMKDLAGDLTELGLNFVPGVGVVSKSGKVLARMPNAVARGAVKGGAMLVDNVAVPVGSQLYDMAAYDEDDPRGQFDLVRVGSQAGGNAAGKAMLKGAGMGIGSKFVDAAEGDAGDKAFKQGIGQYIKDIGYKTDDAIAARQAALDAQAELAKKRANVRLDGQNDISGRLTPGAIIDAENYRVLTAELDRLKAGEKARNAWQGEYAKLNARNEGVARDFNGEPARYASDAEKVLAEKADPDAARNAYQSYMAVNETGEPLVMLEDGRFVRASSIRNVDGTPVFDFGTEYRMPVQGAIRTPMYMYDDPSVISKLPREKDWMYIYPGPGPLGKMQEAEELRRAWVQAVDRNQSVEKAIKSDPLLSRKYAGGINSPGAEIARDFAGSVASNTAAREGVTRNVVGYADPSKMSMEDKRTAALWNRQMNRLRSGIVDKAKTPEQRREYADGVMNALTYGLDNLPEDTFRRNPGLYRAIAAELGQDGWKHWSEQPTTASTQRILED